jgi:hypothetical protein
VVFVRRAKPDVMCLGRTTFQASAASHHLDQRQMAALMSSGFTLHLKGQIIIVVGWRTRRQRWVLSDYYRLRLMDSRFPRGRREA